MQAFLFSKNATQFNSQILYSEKIAEYKGVIR